nr:hypothetical protein [Tanacetum cinerariifolium]
MIADSNGLLPGLMRRDINSLFGQMASLSRGLFCRETTHALVKKKGKVKDKYYGKLVLDLGNEVRSCVEQRTAAMEKLLERLGNTKEKAECKKLKKELEEAMFKNTFIQRPKEAINVLIEDEKSPSSESRGSPHDESVDATIVAERDRKANAGNDARGSGLDRGAVELQRWFEKTESLFGIIERTEVKKVKVATATLQGPAVTWWNDKVATMGLETVNKMPWTEMKQLMTAEFCPIQEVQRMEHELMVEPERVKVDAYIWGLTDNIKGDVTSFKPVNLNEAVCMGHKLMEQKSQARDERILEGKKRKWENFQNGNSSCKSNHRDNSRQTLQNNQKQENARAMIAAPTNGKVSSGSLPLYECCFTHHVGPCTIKFYKCGMIGHKARYCKEKNVAMGENALPILTCYDCGEKGHTRNRWPRKVKQDKVRKVHGRAYAIKDAEPKGLNVVTGMFLLNNRYAFVLFDLGFDRSFMDTRFSSMLNIDPVKIRASYEVELADGRVVSTNTILKGCTL